MPTIQANLRLIRVLLDEPTPQSPSDRTLFELLSNQVVHHETQLQNSGAQWSVANWALTVNSGTEDYLISAADFGKPFLVYTEDLTDPYMPRVEIPFSMLQNTDQFYSGPAQLYATSSQIFTAACISFYRRADSYYARVTPIPGGTATYRVWYEVAPAAPDSLGDAPGLSPFHHLIRAQTALAALPYCSWGDIRIDSKSKANREIWREKTRSLAAVIAPQVEQFQAQFSTYLGTLMQAGVERRQGYGDGYLNESELFGIGWMGPNQWG